MVTKCSKFFLLTAASFAKDIEKFVVACLAAMATGASAPPQHPVWIRIDKVYTSEHGSDVVLLKGVSHKITGTAFGPTDAVDVWLDGKRVAHVPVTGTKGNMTHWPVW